MKRFDLLFSERLRESWVEMDPNDLLKFIIPKAKNILTLELLTKFLNEGKLRIKFGIDPTASDVHLGHIVPIMLLNIFLKAGHHIDLIIGDFTARVGDPTERQTARSMLTEEMIQLNMQTYTSQIGKYVDINSINVHHNSSWLNNYTLRDVFSIFQMLNLSEAMQREDFRERTKNAQGVSLAEVCYGVLMGIDSVYLKSQVEIGGIDQLLNFQQCKKVMSQSEIPEEVAIMTPILEGVSGDGRKMSKSYGNYIAVNASLDDKFGKIMSIPDSLLFQYYCSFALVSADEIDELKSFIENNPFEAKKQLATLVLVMETKDIEISLLFRQQFETRFSKGVVDDKDCTIIEASEDTLVFDCLFSTGQFASKGELRRLFHQGAVKSIIDSTEKLLTTESLALEVKNVVKVGKRRLFKIVIKNN